jgi:hypothetical protein
MHERAAAQTVGGIDEMLAATGLEEVERIRRSEKERQRLMTHRVR